MKLLEVPDYKFILNILTVAEDIYRHMLCMRGMPVQFPTCQRTTMWAREHCRI